VRKIVPVKLSNGRVRKGRYASDDTFGVTGAFHITGPNGAVLTILASDAEHPESDGWEHVSVSLPNRCPNWPEMSLVKVLFWEPEETVVQFHPPESTYISNHPYVLHLWRDVRDGHRLPPPILVGVKEAGDLSNRPNEVDRLERLKFAGKL
jgi:hypothetical protein